MTTRLVRLRRGFTTIDRPPAKYVAGQVVAVEPHERDGWFWHRTPQKSYLELEPRDWEPYEQEPA